MSVALAPPKPACLRCKTLKVRCEKPESGACARCARAGQPCTAAPPSRQGKRSRPPETAQLASETTVTSDSVVTVPEACASSCSALVRGLYSSTPPRSMLRVLLREWAAIALARNGWALMQSTMAMAKECGMNVAELMAGVERVLLPSSPPPLPIAERLRDSSGLFLVRRHVPTPDGDFVTDANDAFVRRVCSIEDMKACWRSNQTDVLSLFVHPDDSQTLPRAIGNLIAQHKPPEEPTDEPTSDAASSVLVAQPLQLRQTTAHVRLLMAPDGGASGEKAYSPVQVNITSVLGTSIELWFSLEFVPLGAPALGAPPALSLDAPLRPSEAEVRQKRQAVSGSEHVVPLASATVEALGVSEYSAADLVARFIEFGDAGRGGDAAAAAHGFESIQSSLMQEISLEELERLVCDED